MKILKIGPHICQNENRMHIPFLFYFTNQSIIAFKLVHHMPLHLSFDNVFSLQPFYITFFVPASISELSGTVDSIRMYNIVICMYNILRLRIPP